MFVREQIANKGKPNEHRYLKVEERYRENGRVRSRVLVNFGNVTNWPRERVHELIQKLSAFCDLDAPQTLLDMDLGQPLEYGTHLVLDQVWQELDLDGLLRRHVQERTERQFDVVPYVKAMIFHRLVQPASKRECFRHWVAGQYLPGGAAYCSQRGEGERAGSTDSGSGSGGHATTVPH